MGKYKYYFTQPKSEIAKDVLNVLLITGLVAIAATSPYFADNLIKGFKKFKKYRKMAKEQKKKVYDVFYQMRKRELINFSQKNHQLYISLTDKGKKVARWMQIDALKINKPKKWDGKWRLVIFDIAQLKRLYREVLRGKLKELGFCLFQKSVWIIPYDCKDEINLLKDFFGLTDKEVRIIVAQDIGTDEEFRKAFNL